MLSGSRDGARVSFFDEIAYLYVDWSMLSAKISRISVKVGWYEDVALQKSLHLNSVPEVVIADFKSGIHERAVLTQNIELYRVVVKE